MTSDIGWRVNLVENFLFVDIDCRSRAVTFLLKRNSSADTPRQIGLCLIVLTTVLSFALKQEAKSVVKRYRHSSDMTGIGDDLHF